MKLAIKGHITRGKEVIEILEMLGGVNYYDLDGTMDNCPYYIYNNKIHHWEGINVENFIVFTLEEFEKLYPYKVGDKVIFGDIDNIVWEIESMQWVWLNNEIKYIIRDNNKSRLCDIKAEHLQPYKEETNMKDNKATGSRIDFSLTERIELDLGDTHEVVVENGKTYVVKKKPQYPKDYKECCEVLSLGKDGRLYTKGYKASLIQDFQKLYICREAYWKIAGKEMGLDKPWKPDWKNNSQHKYIIFYYQDEITLSKGPNVNRLLSFPTAEMRDAFCENFKDLIEQCKELLL